MHIPATSEAPKSPPNLVRLVCHSLDSDALKNRTEAGYFTDAWNRLRQYGHAPILVFRSRQGLAESLAQVEESGLVSPEYLICGEEHQIYDNCSGQVLTSSVQAGLTHEDWALEWLLEQLEIDPSAMLRAGEDFFHNQDLIDQMIGMENRLAAPPL